MRKINAVVFMSLDGVMQALGAPEEDPTGGFEFGGWVWPYFDEVVGAVMGEDFTKPFDLLLGRFTYDIFAAYWPYFPMEPGQPGYDAAHVHTAKAFNACTKYVATHRPEGLSWKNTQWLGQDVVAKLRELKKQDGPPMVIQGSSELTQQLLKADLIDRFQLRICPLLLGSGKRLFGDGTIPAGLKLTASTSSPRGVVIATYERDGAVKPGSLGADNPSPAELERRTALATP
ncbi:dihydrofolate reductase family protein [Pendulispora albinea]|uniref:Dihydrofolate reductase family protein n=1 Tax=Pendulispora albinea TaxID=2741071 RepID=A0ABZ2M7B2_9BACT